MDLKTVLRIMLKRWYASAPALLLALALPAATWAAVPAKYQSTSTISLLNSAAAASGTNRTGNPFTAFDTSLNGMADYLARTLDSDQTLGELAQQGVTDQAVALLAPNASGPFITLTVTGTDPARVLAEMRTYDDYAIAELTSVQVKTLQALHETLPTNTLLRAIVMVPPQTPLASSKSKMEDAAGAAAAGMVLMVVASLGAEAVAVRRGKAPAVPRRRSAASRRALAIESAEPAEVFEPAGTARSEESVTP